MDTNDAGGWRFDKTINLPSLGIAVSAIIWVAFIYFQTTANTAAIANNETRWANFMQAREQVVRQYEQRMTTQENMAHEIMRRLDEIRTEQLRVGENLLRREEETRRTKP